MPLTIFTSDMATKAQLRADMKARLAAQSPSDRLLKSLAIGEKLLESEFFRRAATVSFFASLPSEVQTGPMIDRALAAGKRVLLPRTDLARKELALYEIHDRLKDLSPGVMGIPEPAANPARAASLDETDLVLVPGLCFDFRMNRIGFGAGIYDRFLKNVPPQAAKVGLAFAFQVLPEIPVEAHDVPLDFILTEA